MATVKMLLNGPCLVDGADVRDVDWNGASYQRPNSPFALTASPLRGTRPL
jgi:hypothetical protein